MSSTDFTLDSSLRAGLTDDEGVFDFRPTIQSTPIEFQKPRNKAIQEWLFEYRSTVASLENEISNYQSSYKELKNQVVQLIEENQSLNQELQTSVRERMIPVTDGRQNEAQVELLKHQLEATNDAKDSALQMWNMALSEIERLERTVQKCQKGTDLSLLEARAAEIHREYSRALELVQTEADKAKKEFLKSVTDSEKLRKDLSALLDRNKRLNDQIDSQNLESGKQKAALVELRTELLQLRTERDSLLDKFQREENRTKELDSGNQQQARTLRVLEKENQELRRREEDCLQRARQSLRLVEEALLEKDAAVFREQEAHKEMEQLQKSLDDLAQSVSQTTNEAVESGRRRHDEIVHKLSQEIKALEAAKSETECRLEATTREKRSLEAECHRLRSEWTRSEGGGELFQTLLQRLSEAELHRDNHKMRAEALEVSLREANSRLSEEKETFSRERDRVGHWLKDCQAQLQSKMSECNLLLKEKETWRSKMNSQQSTDDRIQAQLRNQVSVLQRRMEEVTSEHQSHLQAERQVHSRSLQDITSLLKPQQDLTNKWKKEAEQLTERFEEEVSVFQKKASDLRQQKSDLAKELTLFKDRARKLEQQLSSSSMENESLRKRLNLYEQLYQANLSS